MQSNVTFNYAFSTPHRLCVCLPEASHKVLYDAYPDHFDLLWSDGDTRKFPLGAYMQLPIDWHFSFYAQMDGAPLPGDKWHRKEGWLPVFCYRFKRNGVSLQVTAGAGLKGDVMLLQIENEDKLPHQVKFQGLCHGNVINEKWRDPQLPYSYITPIFGDRGDRVVIFSSQKGAACPAGREHIDADWMLAPGEKTETFFVCPLNAFMDSLESLLIVDWKMQLEEGVAAWRTLLDRAPRLNLPDPMVSTAYLAGLADIFVMREPQANGQIAGLAGTQVYRAANTGEPCFQAQALCRSGYWKEARDNIDFVTQFQLEDGNWEDARQWGRYMWCNSGFKSRCIREYYTFTGDRAFLERQYPHMLNNSRWSQAQREKTKKDPASPEYGLMPRGMGDCGLMNGDDLFGVFYPHNFLHWMGLENAAWAARELGKEQERAELQSYADDLRNCLLAFLEKGCISEPDGSRWIPGTPGKVSGSRWGVADAAYPAGLLSPFHPLIEGTMKKLRSDLSEGGLPKDLGWLKGGLWVAIALDAMAYVSILRGESQNAADALYAVLNHATPLLTWCEERLPEKETHTITGDLEHAWTPICVARFVRDMLAMERDGVLHLCSAIPDCWLTEGEKIEAAGIPTFFGKVNMRLQVRDGALFYHISTQHAGFPIILHGKNKEVRLTAETQPLIGSLSLE